MESRMPESTSSARGKTVASLAANAFGVLDSQPSSFVNISRASSAQLRKLLGLPAKVAARIVALRKKGQLTCLAELRAVPGLQHRAFKSVWNKVFFDRDGSLRIRDVTAARRFIWSGKPFALRVDFGNASDSPVVVVSVIARWAGEPFVVEHEIGPDESRKGQAEIEFDAERTLPVGPAEFCIALYRADGAQASFRRTFFVLPSNPLSLSLSPAGAIVTGTWSARGAYVGSSDTFSTQLGFTIANGDGSAVTMNRRLEWKFWDGGIGGTLVESGAFDLSGSMNVPAHGTLPGNIVFTSPNGSGVYNKYHGKEDMTLEIALTATDGRRITASITCRVMLAYGINIIKVGDFDAQEGVDLYTAVDLTRQVYEKRDITFREVRRWIIHNADAGSYTVINSEDEFRDLLEDWSVQNDYVDVFVAQSFSWSTYNGYAGDIPGPASKGGRKDGVAVDKTSYTDASGVKRLNISVLGPLIGHEVGHYLGLSHLEETNNLMRANTGDRGQIIKYDQYRTMFPHGFMVFE
ncbi:MAG: hypothetical protein DMF37_03435 [Verrucomicrobia bacterium]|nr:MAG: hypothetical protein DMF37_03435 [Verrucomicrobiota bacterium]